MSHTQYHTFSNPPKQEKFKLRYKEKKLKYRSCMAKSKKWSLSHWVTVSHKKVLNSLLDTPFCPTSYRYIPLLPPPCPLRHAIQHRYCNKRRPLSTLLKSYRVRTLLLGNRKTILLKWTIAIAVSFKFWFHHLHVLLLVTKSACLKMKFSCYRTKNIPSFSREAIFSQPLLSR